MCLSTYAMSIDLQSYGQTHVTHFAMEEILSTTNATNATAIAMILFLISIVEQVTDETGVL